MRFYVALFLDNSFINSSLYKIDIATGDIGVQLETTPAITY